MRNLADKIKRVGVIGNLDKASCAEAVSRAARLVAAAGRKLYTDPATALLPKLKAAVCTDVASLARQVDLLLVFGGDGTLLHAAREIAGSRTPILGINIGSLGFLTAVPSTELAMGLKQIWAGEYSFEERVLIEAGAHIETIKQRLGHSSIRVTSDVYGSLLPTVDEGVTTALEQRFAKFSRTNRGLEPDAGNGPELS